MARWAMITGTAIASQSVPLRLNFPRGERMGASLEIRVTPAFAPILQHQEPLIIERVNSFFGYRAVSRILLQQGPLPPKPARAAAQNPQAPPDQEALVQSSHLAKGVADDDLRHLLERWGADLLAKKHP
ncbi:hypothetical protein AQ1_01477 [alpha proteobacterium Q-1]|nr:hypothetical protein AQ1_01477 [alpha proteobacterium Q-1]